MRAGHHDLAAERRVGAGDLRDHVVRVAIRLVEAGLHVHGQLHGDALLQQARHQVVVFGDEHDGGNGIGAGVAAGDEDRAVLADVRLERDAHAFGLEAGQEIGGRHRRCGAGPAAHQVARGRRPIGADEVLLHRAGHDDGATQLAGLGLQRGGIGSGSHTGVAVIVPLVEADHPFG